MDGRFNDTQRGGLLWPLARHPQSSTVQRDVRRDESHDFPDGLLGIFRYERHQVGELQALAVGGEKEEGGRVEEDDYAEDHDEDQEADWKVLRAVLAEN